MQKSRISAADFYGAEHLLRLLCKENVITDDLIAVIIILIACSKVSVHVYQ